MCDTEWLTETPVNPLAVGQYVNNQSNSKYIISYKTRCRSVIKPFNKNNITLVQ